MKLKYLLLFFLLELLLEYPSLAHGATDLRPNYAFGGINSFGELMTYLVPLAFTLAGIIVVFYITIAAFDFIMSQGDKNATAAARDKIVHAIIGLILLIAAFIAVRYLPYALGLGSTLSIFNL